MISAYEGEEIIEKIVISGGVKNYHRKYIPRSVFHDPEDKPAFILGNAPSRSKIDITKLKEHGYTYGCNAIYRDFTPDFLVTVDVAIAGEIVESGYAKDNVVYGGYKSILTHGEDITLIPKHPAFSTGNTATHIASFDGHKEVYLIGFNPDPKQKTVDNIYNGTNCYKPEGTTIMHELWVKQLQKIFEAYPNVNYYLVDMEHIPFFSYFKNTSNVTIENFKDKFLI